MLAIDLWLLLREKIIRVMVSEIVVILDVLIGLLDNIKLVTPRKQCLGR